MVYTDPTGLAPYLNGIYDGPYNPDYNPGVPVEGPKTNPNGMPQNQTPNITGPSNVQTFLPPVPDVKTDGRNLNEKIIETERKSKTVLDWIQTALDVLGVIPVFGEAADGINGLISLGRGDTLGAALSFASMIPVVGDSIGKGGKAARFVAKNGDEIVAGTKRVFWSGLGKDGANIAERWAKENGGETLEMYLKRKGIDAPNFAETSSGEVDALIGPYVRNDSIWNTIEKPILNNNKNVTSINVINPLEK